MGNDLIQGLNFYTLWHTGLIIAMAPANLKDGEHHYMLLSMVKADDEPSCIPAPQSWDGIPSLCAPYACTLLGTANSLCIKRLKSIEKGARHPLLDICFFTTTHAIKGERHYQPIYNIGPHLLYQTGHYELLQLTNRIDEGTTEETDEQRRINDAYKEFYQQFHEHGPERTVRRKFRGYFFLAYKTMEHMSTMKFAQSWKTWSGARLICASLPQPYFFRRISFFRQSGSSAEFTYIVLIQINHLMVSAEAALNLASSFRQRLCAYVGVYREIDFTVDQHTGQQLRLRCSPIRLPSRPSISVDLRRLISPNVHHCSENGIGVNGQVITSEFDKPYQAPFQQSTNHFYEARMLPKSNNYADDLLLIDIVEQNHTSSPNQIDGGNMTPLNTLRKQYSVPSPTPTQNNPASSSSDESNTLSEYLDPIQVTPDGHAIVRPNNGYVQPIFKEAKVNNLRNAMFPNERTKAAPRTDNLVPLYGTFENHQVQAPARSFQVPLAGGMESNNGMISSRLSKRGNFFSKWSQGKGHNRGNTHEMLYENTYIVDESPINRNNDCYHSPMFSRNEFSEAKAKQQRLRNLDTREDSFTTQQIHRRRRKQTSFAEPNKTDKRQRHVTIDIEDMSEEDSGCEEGAATFRGTNTNYIDGRKSRMGSRERDEQQSVHDHSTSPIPFSPPVPVLLTKEGSMHESNHPVRQLIARLKPLQLTTTSSHGRSKHNSRFNEAAVKNAGVHLLRKSSELKEENYEKAVPLQDAEYVWRKKRSWSLRSSTYNTRSQSKRRRNSSWREKRSK